jgi:hypothetical protein
LWQSHLFFYNGFIKKLTNVILCQNSPMCCKHEVLLGCSHTTSPQANLKHLKHKLLQTHMEDIWQSCHCDPKLWTHVPCPLHFQFSHTMSMGCPCTTIPLITEKCAHHILPLLGLGNIWHMPLIVPNHDNVVIPFASLLNYLSFNLIAQHNSFSKKIWNHNNNKK